MSNILNDPIGQKGNGLLYYLGELGEKAKPTVPLRVEALKDEKTSIWSEVNGALKEIDPEAAAKAGVK
jgi:hypothetical protein